MCGIAGFYSHNNNFTKDDLFRMMDVISHRGPDAEGYFINRTIALGHKRLSIIDLSERANQPFRSQDNRYIIIYNGEVYNYIELCNSLTKSDEKKEISFKTSSDTEVIIEGYSRFGEDFINDLNGMFSFAIYDTILDELLLTRDRLGIKPMFYYWDGNSFAFASEIKSILQLDIPRIINKEAISNFLHLGYIQSPFTIYKNIYKLHSGCFLKISKSGIKLKKYWNVLDNINIKRLSSEREAMSMLTMLLENSVELQLRSDVPFGVFLSGGVDSSLVASTAVRVSDSKINTFSIGFEEPRFNEAQHAKKIAKFLNTNHHEFIVSYKDAINLIEDYFILFDEPFSDSSAFPTMLVSKLAQKYVKVTLSGDGGDELFLGYGAYKWAKRLQNPLIKLLKNPASKIFEFLPSRYKRVGKLLDYNSEIDLFTHIFSQEQYLFSKKELDVLLVNQTEINEADEFSDYLKSFDETNITSRFLSLTDMANEMELQAIHDIIYYLQDDLLTKVDRSSMHYSIENRVPLLDHRIVEFAVNLSSDLKYKNGISKYLLKKMLLNYLPEVYFNRPKQGFSIPLVFWLKNELSYLIELYLSEEKLKNYGIVNSDIVRQIKKEFAQGSDYLYNRLWALIVLHKWMEDKRIND